VYRAVREQAVSILRQGHSVVADAVFARPAERQMMEQVAAEAGVPFAGFWLEAPEGVLLARTVARGPDASDSTAAVVRLQQTQEVGAITWTRVDAAAPAAAVFEQVAAHVRARLPQTCNDAAARA
jgi:predicted kinase